MEPANRCLSAQAKKSDVLIDGTLERLISEQKISSDMTTSLANDSANVANITKRLIEIAELLYINSDTLMKNAEVENGNSVKV